jgi:tripartite-type tricarboxylate transporter receptor subunit TctC
MQKRKWLALVTLAFLGLMLISSLVLTGCAEKTVTSTTTSTTTATAVSTTTPKTTSVESAADFFKGKRMQIWNASDPGGSNDVYARLAGSYLSDMLGVNVAVISKPAGGGLAAPNELYSSAKNDGLTIAWVSSGKVFGNWLLDAKEAQFDASKFTYLGNMRKGSFILCVTPNGKYTTVDALKAGKGLKAVSSSPSSLLTLSQIVVYEALSIDAKITMGLSTGDRALALMRGEADIASSSHATGVNLDKTGQVKNLLQISYTREATAKDVPCLAEVTTLTDYHKKLLNLIFDDGVMVIAPPGVPADRLKILQDAFATILADKAFQTSAATFSDGMFPGWDSGPAMEKTVTTLAAGKADMKLFDPLITKYTK